MEKLKLPKLKTIQNIDNFIKYKIGDKKNGFEVLPLEKRKKILLLSDDLRFFSGVATQSKMLTLNTAHQFRWVQLGGSINPKDKGQLVDLSEQYQKESGVEDAECKVYVNDNYGNPDILRQLIKIEKPDAILLFTDPRQWGWLYNMEYEIKQQGIPILYWAIWDSPPAPMWNRPYYLTCDLLMGISRQSHQIHKSVLRNDDFTEKNKKNKYPKKIKGTVVEYVPHGLDPETYRPIDSKDEDYQEFEIFKNDFATKTKVSKDAFVLLWNSRNIRRKNPSDIILAYKHFCDGLGPEKAKDCVLVMHTDPVDNHGTDLPAVKEAICPDYKVVFSAQKINNKVLNYYYNLADVVISIASNEGFGLTSCEAIMAGTPAIINVTGGLQDQCGFKDENGDYITTDDLSDTFMTNATGKYTNHGEWVKPVFPKVRTVKGSPPTPYIFDDYCSYHDVALKMQEWYDIPKAERKQKGLLGREYLISEGFTSESVSNTAMEVINYIFSKWTSPKLWSLSSINAIDNRTVGVD